jgi:hypothetical protein
LTGTVESWAPLGEGPRRELAKSATGLRRCQAHKATLGTINESGHRGFASDRALTFERRAIFSLNRIPLERIARCQAAAFSSVLLDRATGRNRPFTCTKGR